MQDAKAGKEGKSEDPRTLVMCCHRTFLNYLPLNILLYEKTKQNEVTIPFGSASLESLLLSPKYTVTNLSDKVSPVVGLEVCCHKAEDGKSLRSTND